jgi:hypothetical protein
MPRKKVAESKPTPSGKFTLLAPSGVSGIGNGEHDFKVIDGVVVTDDQAAVGFLTANGFILQPDPPSASSPATKGKGIGTEQPPVEG